MLTVVEIRALKPREKPYKVSEHVGTLQALVKAVCEERLAPPSQ